MAVLSLKYLQISKCKPVGFEKDAFVKKKYTFLTYQEQNHVSRVRTVIITAG